MFQGSGVNRGRKAANVYSDSSRAAEARIHHGSQRLHREGAGPAIQAPGRRGPRRRFHGRRPVERRRGRRARAGPVARSTVRRRSRHSRGRGGFDGRPDARRLGRQLQRDAAAADGLSRAGRRPVRADLVRRRIRLRFPGQRGRVASAHHQRQFIRRHQDHERAHGARRPCRRRNRLHHHPAGRRLRPRIPCVGDRASGNDARRSIPASRRRAGRVQSRLHRRPRGRHRACGRKARGCGPDLHADLGRRRELRRVLRASLAVARQGRLAPYHAEGPCDFAGRSRRRHRTPAGAPDGTGPRLGRATRATRHVQHRESPATSRVLAAG